MSDIDRAIIDDCILHTKDNELDILRSTRCACIFCKADFSARAVKDWANEGGKNFGLCPNCGCGTLVSDFRAKPFTDDLVDAIHLAWTLEKGDYSFYPEFSRFCTLFNSFNIDHNQHNTELFVEYAIGLSRALEDDCDQRFAPAALRLMAEGYFDIAPNPRAAIDIAEEDTFRCNAKVLSYLSSLYFTHQGEIDEESQNARCFKLAKEAACLGDIAAVAFLSALYLEGVGCDKDEDMADALMDNYFPYAFSCVQNLNSATDYAGLSFFFYEYALGLYEEYKGSKDMPCRDILRFFLIAKQCLLLVGFHDEDRAFDDIKDAIQQVEKVYAPEGFDKEIYYDEHSFYDTFIDCNSSMTPVCVDSVEYDGENRVLHITIAPYSQYILVDTSSAQTRVAAREKVSFHINGVTKAWFPEGPFAFTSISIPDDHSSSWQLLDGLEPVVDIQFDPLYLRDED